MVNTYYIFPVKTKLINRNDNLLSYLPEVLKGKVRRGDIVFVSEKIVAITQGRAIPLKDIKPSKIAKILSRFVTKTPNGIGIGIPETMHMAIKEVGLLRILLASAVSAITKPFGIRGCFYKIAGSRVRAIDGPTEHTIKPYNEYVVLGPKAPDVFASSLSYILGCDVVVVDINDLGGNILGTSNSSISKDYVLDMLSDNPLGQESQQTPVGIIYL